MKNLLYLAIGMLATASLAQNDIQNNIWYTFQTPATGAVANTTIPDTPFILKDKDGTPTDYTLPVYFEAVKKANISDVMIDINHISAKFDRRGRQIIYLSGKIDLSCCFDGPISIDFFDSSDNLVQKTTTDADGMFKIKSINGNMFDIKGNKIRFNFSKLKTYDQNADIRYATIERIKSSLDTADSTQEKSIVKKVANNKL